MRRTSIGTWAFNVGPYGENPIPFPTVLEQLAELKFDGLELGGFNGYPNPQNHPTRDDRDAAQGRGRAPRARLLRLRPGPVERAAPQHPRHLALHRELQGQLRLRRRPRHQGRPGRHRPAADHPPRGRATTSCSSGWSPPGTAASAMPATRASTSPGSSSPASPSTSPRTSSACWRSCRTRISACSTTPATARWSRSSAPARRAGRRPCPAASSS